MSGGRSCQCPESKKPIAERAWRIIDYKCNYSAFSGYRQTASDYSKLRCSKCRTIWNTKANYVDHVLMQSEAEKSAWLANTDG